MRGTADIGVRLTPSSASVTVCSLRPELTPSTLAAPTAGRSTAATFATVDQARAVAVGWLRFFLVQDGHIHRSTPAAGRITTRIGWLPELSARLRPRPSPRTVPCCTKCFPSAPVEWTRGKDDPSKCNGAPDYDTKRGRYAFKCRECG